MTEQTPILSVQGLCAGYRGHTVLRDISFALAPGEILCVGGGERLRQEYAAAGADGRG